MTLAVETKNLWFQYPGRQEPTLKDVSFRINSSEFVLVSGPTGSGKSTLLSCLNGLIPAESNGTLRGKVKILGRSTSAGPAALFPAVATVPQNPNPELTSGLVADEVAFALENLCLGPDEIRHRVEKALRAVGLHDKAEDSTETLSGGQRQRLAIAAAIAVKPKLLLLDEPISQLDSEGADQILDVLSSLISTGNITIVIVEHLWKPLLPLATKVLQMDCGELVYQGSPGDFKERMAGIETAELKTSAITPLPPDTEKGKVVLSMQDVGYKYPGTGAFSLRHVSLDFHRGERVALLGPNGSGKSTLLSLIAGILKPSSGAIRFELPCSKKRLIVSMLLQDPDLMLFRFSVKDELAFAPLNMGFKGLEALSLIKDAMSLTGLSELSEEAPFALSRGQRLRVALASLLTARPQILLLDEPTTGQDGKQVKSLISNLEGIADLLIFSTHNYRFARSLANRVIVMEKGEVKDQEWTPDLH